MGTEVLRPQDCLIRGSSPGGLFSRRRNYNGSYNPNSNYYYYCNNNNNISHHHHHNSNGNGNARTNRKPVVRHERPTNLRRHQRAQSEPSVSRRSVYDDLKVVSSVDDNSSKGLLKILRRGESFDSKIKSNGGVSGGAAGADTDLLSPPNMYAGSGFAVSPAPSSLPLPSFSKKKQTSVDDSATRDIKRLLRLDL